MKSRKRKHDTPDKAKKHKKQKVLEEQIQIQQDNGNSELIQQKDSSLIWSEDSISFEKQFCSNLNCKMQNKLSSKQKSRKLHLKIKEDNKENMWIEEDSKIMMPFEIK